MCGIAGGFNLTSKLDLELVLASLHHRGPDNQQYIAHKRCVLAHTRLSILDQSISGAQPFQFQHLICVFNGEIYNYREIKQELTARGYRFESGTDTEVLVKAFHCWKLQTVDKLIGMFAFALYDSEEQELFLFRDRVGVKPLYYASTSYGELYFGSEMKVFYHFPVARTIKKSSVAEYLRFGYISKDNTIFKEVKKVLPGHYLHVRNGRCTLKKYWDVQNQAGSWPEVKSENQWLEELEETMISAFKYRMVSDVPVGVFLSGGIDSSLVAAILQKHYGTINTFTLGFDINSFSEATYAKKVASFLGTTHTEKILSIDSSRETLLRFYDIYDEPFADSSGVPMALISSIARENGVKVVLSADGGDELFGGYTHYLRHTRLYGRMKKAPATVKSSVAGALPFLLPNIVRKNIYKGNFEHRCYALEEMLKSQSFVEFYEGMIANQAKKEIGNLMNGYADESAGVPDIKSDPMEQMMRWDFLHYLPDDLLVKVDRATMFHGIEGREPFLDHRLVSLANAMPLDLKIRNGTGKYALRKILAKYLPEKYFERPKMGFSIPLFDWFKQDFDALFDKYLSVEMIEAAGVFNYAEVQNERKKYEYNKLRGQQHNIEKMWRILSFMMWWAKWGKDA